LYSAVRIIEPARALHRKLAEAEPFVKHRHARPLSGDASIKRKIAAKIDLAAAAIDVARLHFPDPQNEKQPELHIRRKVAQPKSIPRF
jgi:hypothetical protein